MPKPNPYANPIPNPIPSPNPNSVLLRYANKCISMPLSLCH